MCASISSANEDEIINTLLNFKYEVMQYMCSRAVFGIRFFFFIHFKVVYMGKIRSHSLNHSEQK